MDQAMQFYRRENDVTQPVGFVDNAQLAQWAAETEIEKGRGAARRGGKWQVRLASGTNMDQVLKVYEKVRAAGYGAELSSAVVNEKRVYTARIRSLPSKADAQVLADELKGKVGVENAKVVS
jgi:cell division septation protein DedD